MISAPVTGTAKERQHPAWHDSQGLIRDSRLAARNDLRSSSSGQPVPDLIIDAAAHRHQGESIASAGTMIRDTFILPGLPSHPESGWSAVGFRAARKRMLPPPIRAQRKYRWINDE
jgi:hypothetical protein